MPQEGAETVTEEKPKEGEKPDESGKTKEATGEGKKPEAGKTTETKFEDLPQETQDEIRRLRSENADRRKAAQEAQARLDAIEDEGKSEKEKAEAKAARAEERATKSEAELLRYKVATDKKIPADAVGLLTATTQEDLEAQADSILKLRGSADDGKRDFGGGARDEEPVKDKPEDAHQKGIMEILGLQPAPPE